MARLYFQLKTTVSKPTVMTPEVSGLLEDKQYAYMCSNSSVIEQSVTDGPISKL